MAITIELKEVHGLIAVIDGQTILRLVVFHVDSGRLGAEDAGKKRRGKAKNSHCVSVIFKIKFIIICGG